MITWNLTPSKDRAITRCLGTKDWKAAFYEQSPQGDLFGDPAIIRTAELNDLLTFVRQRLETIFPYVEEPLILPPTGSPLFALFFAVGNPAPAAISLSKKVAKHILHNKR